MSSYFSFPKECPSGIVNEQNFKEIYAQFFPQGGMLLEIEFIFTNGLKIKMTSTSLKRIDFLSPSS